MRTETGEPRVRKNRPAKPIANVKHGPILVTGSHRSGTTWVGRILSAAPRARLVHEPFNLSMVSPARSFDPGVWYRYIHDGNADEYRDAIRRTLKTQPYHHDLSHGDPSLQRTIRAHLAFAIRRRRDRVIYKDPLAFFSTPWLARELGMIPVVMIRHPAAFVASVLLKNWRFDFANFTRQPALMVGPLAPWHEQIKAAAKTPSDFIDHAILLWNCIYGTAQGYREAHPDWIFRTHEDMSLDHVAEFEKLFAELGLEFGPDQRRELDQMSGAHNPAEQGKNQFFRNSRETIHTWKTRLDATQIDRVMKGTEKVRLKFYPE